MREVIRSALPATRGVLCVALLGALGGACARLPAAVGPAVVGGPVIAAQTEPAFGKAPPDAPLGPVALTRAWVRVEDDIVEWGLEVENPSSEKLGVTLVLRLQDASGAVQAHDSISFLLGGGDRREVVESLRADVAAVAAADRWQVESWVRRLPPPERRTLRVTD